MTEYEIAVLETATNLFIEFGEPFLYIAQIPYYEILVKDFGANDIKPLACATALLQLHCAIKYDDLEESMWAKSDKYLSAIEEATFFLENSIAQ